MSDGRIIIDTEINSSGAEKDINSLSGKLSGLAKTGLAAFTSAIAAAGTAIGGLATIATKYNSQMEDYFANFTVLLGSTTEATKHVEDLKRFAAKTPFEMAGLADASKQLLSFGIGVEDIMPDLQMLGDISLGNQERFKGLALVFAQVASAGKLTGQDLLQFINQGFNPLQVIAEKTGKSMADLKEEMSQGKISYEMVAEAMKVATSEGGKFYQGMEVQSQTLSGMWSTLKDDTMSLIGDAFMPFSNTLKESVMPALQGIVEQMSAAFADPNTKESIDNIASGLGELATKVAELASELLPKLIDGFAWFLDNGEGIAIIIGTIATAMIAFKAGALMTTIVQSWQQAQVALALYKMTAEGATISQGVMNGAFTIWETIVALMTGQISLATAATGLWSKATAALNAVWAANPIGVVLVAIVALVGAIIYLWNTNEGFRNFLIGAWNSMIQIMKEVDAWITNIFTQNWVESFGIFGNVLNGLSKIVVDVWGGIKKIFDGIIDFVAGVFTGNWSRAWSGVVNIFGGIMNGLGAVIKAPLNAVIGLVNMAIDGLNGISVKIPSWVPVFGGQSFGINLPKMNYLYTGGVFDKPTLLGNTVVGDKYKGKGSQREWVLPDKLLRETIDEVVGNNLRELVAKMQGTVDYETTMTTARVSAYNNTISGGNEIDNNNSKERPIVVEANLIVDSKEFTQTVVAPNQDVLTEYYEGR